MVRGDADQFRHFLAQLTSNAFMKATSVRVDLNLLSTKDDTSVVGLRVQNSGPGMTEAELDVCIMTQVSTHRLLIN
jgi:signal transduction histidine kinase